MKKKIVKGKELVPVQKFQEVQETHIEVKEELVKGVRTVWKKVEEPYEKIVKRPVPVTKTVRVPYTDYEEKEVEMVVEVPCDTMEEKEGYRMDTTIKMQPVEVEQDEVYELIPHLVSRGEVKIKPGDHAQDLGCVSIGRECFPSDQPHHHRSGQKSSPKTPIVSKDENHHHSRHRRAIDEYHQHVVGEHGEGRQRPKSVSGTRAALVQGMDREALIQRLKNGGAPKAPTSARRVEYQPNSARPTSATVRPSSAAVRPGSATGARRIARYERYERQQQQREQQLLLPGDPPHGAGLMEKRGPRVAVHKA